MASWGPLKGYTGGGYSLTEAAKRTAAEGYEWVALQLDDDGSGQDAKDIAEFNQRVYPDWQEANRREGMLAGCWFTQGGSLYLAPPDSDLAIAEIEGPGDYDGVAYVIAQGQLPKVPLAAVTNFASFTYERARLLIDAGFTCLPEAYMNENVNHTPTAMDYTARNLGWPTSQPVAGVYPVGGQPVPSYAAWADWPLVDYLLEYVI